MLFNMLAPIFEYETKVMKETGQIINRNLRSLSKEIVSIFWKLDAERKGEKLNVVIVTKKKKGVPDKELSAKINDAVLKTFGFQTKTIFVSASDFSGKFFTSKSSLKRFEKDFSKLKGAPLSDLIDTAPKKKRAKK